MLSIQNLTSSIGEFNLNDICLEINDGDYFVLLGPSGAGKTVLFETIAGIYLPDSGKIVINGKDITYSKIRSRQIGVVFQDGAIFPHLTVAQNISYPLKIKKLSKKEIRLKVLKLADQMGITQLLHRKPETLSGGELRRVAIARTLSLDPECLLLDEPLSSIDAQLRDDILGLLKNLNKSGLTILHITHDYREAFYLANKLAVIDKGRIVQQGTPAEIVARPGSKFVAGFIGIKNYFEYKVVSEDEIIIENSVRLKKATTTLAKGKAVIPQESIRILTGSEKDIKVNFFNAKILDMVHFPENIELMLDIGIPLHVVLNAELAKEIMDRNSIGIEIDAEKFDFI